MMWKEPGRGIIKVLNTIRRRKGFFVIGLNDLRATGHMLRTIQRCGDYCMILVQHWDPRLSSAVL